MLCNCSRLVVVGGVGVATIEEVPLADDYPRAGDLYCRLRRVYVCILCN